MKIFLVDELRKQIKSAKDWSFSFTRTYVELRCTASDTG